MVLHSQVVSRSNIQLSDCFPIPHSSLLFSSSLSPPLFKDCKQAIAWAYISWKQAQTCTGILLGQLLGNSLPPALLLTPHTHLRHTPLLPNSQSPPLVDFLLKSWSRSLILPSSFSLAHAQFLPQSSAPSLKGSKLSLGWGEVAKWLSLVSSLLKRAFYGENIK